MAEDNIWCQETHVNQTDGYKLHETIVYETCTSRKGDLFRSFMKSHGKCSGKMYLDVRTKEIGTDEPEKTNSVEIGWIFVKRVKYEDSPETYLHETWISLFKSEPVTIVRYHYLSDAIILSEGGE